MIQSQNTIPALARALRTGLISRQQEFKRSTNFWVIKKNTINLSLHYFGYKIEKFRALLCGLLILCGSKWCENEAKKAARQQYGDERHSV